MAWTAPMVHTLLLKTAPPPAPKPIPVPGMARPVRSPSPRGISAEMASGYQRK